MSRVKHGQKYMNTPKNEGEQNPSKITRTMGDSADYRKAGTLSSWLFLKYNMKYSTYKSKSKARKQALRDEYYKDTGRTGKDVEEDDIIWVM